MRPRATILILLAVWAGMGASAAVAAAAAASGRTVQWQAVSQREPSANAARHQAQQQLLQLAHDEIGRAHV